MGGIDCKRITRGVQVGCACFETGEDGDVIKRGDGMGAGFVLGCVSKS